MLYYTFSDKAAAREAGRFGGSVTAAEELFTSTFDGEALGGGRRSVEENRLLLTETMLATLWVINMPNHTPQLSSSSFTKKLTLGK